MSDRYRIGIQFLKISRFYSGLVLYCKSGCDRMYGCNTDKPINHTRIATFIYTLPQQEKPSSPRPLQSPHPFLPRRNHRTLRSTFSNLWKCCPWRRTRNLQWTTARATCRASPPLRGARGFWTRTQGDVVCSGSEKSMLFIMPGMRMVVEAGIV